MVGQTFSEKLLSVKSGKRVYAGDVVVAKLDLVYMHDGTAPLAIKVLREEFGEDRVWDPSRILFFVDHVAPSSNVDTSRLHKSMREFARKHGIKLFEAGYGINHQVVFEEGYAVPGALIVGADSHTVTQGAVGAFATGVGSTDAAIAMMTGTLWFKVPESLKIILEGRLGEAVLGKDVALYLLGELGTSGANYMTLEFHGPGVRNLSLESRLTIANMSVEMGAKNAYFPPDEVVMQHLERVGAKLPVKPVYPDPDAEYVDTISVELDEIEPLVAAPPLPSNVKHVSEVEGVEVDQVFIGSCTNGRVEDFHAAARILKGRRVKDGVRCIAIPASRRVFYELLRDGTLEILVKAGCTVTHGTCGPCVGAHFGILGPGEVMVATSNRNFPGRVGDRTAKIYLANPYTAAAAAVEGRIVDPRSLLKKT